MKQLVLLVLLTVTTLPRTTQAQVALPDCDLIVQPSQDLQALVDDAGYAVYCLTPGDYGAVTVSRDGTAGTPLYLRYYNAADPGDNSPSYERSTNDQAVLTSINIGGNYWTVYGLRLAGFAKVDGNSDNIILITGDHATVDGIDLDVAGTPDDLINGFLIRGESSYATIQNSLISVAVPQPNKDMACIRISETSYATIINNEMRDCAGDAIAISVGDAQESRPGIRIENNEMYLTPALYVDCVSDADAVPPGYQCACAENAIDIKHTLSSSTNNPPESDWLQIRQNVIYGFRPTEGTCAGSGSLGPVITTPGSRESHYTLIEDNVIYDVGIALRQLGKSKDLIFRNNIVKDVFNKILDLQGGDSQSNLTVENNTLQGTSDLQYWGKFQANGSLTIQDNILVNGKDRSGSSASSYSIGSNVFVNTDVYTLNYGGSDDIVYDSADDITWGKVCFTIERFTNPREKCLDYAVPGSGLLAGEGFRGLVGDGDGSPPAPDAASVLTDVDQAQSVGLTAIDADGDPLSYVIVADPTHGTLSGQAPNLVYTPDTGYTGGDAFTFEVNDGDYTIQGVVTIVVGTGASFTQELTLVRGWNTVSLNVEPMSAQIASVVAGISEDLVVVMNSAGDMYFPKHNLDQIGTWNPDEAYQVNVRLATTFEVGGTDLVPPATPIDLLTGWNLIPYLPAEALPIETALGSIMDSMTMAIDHLGQIYYPALGIDEIGQMEPGQGYSVFVEQDTTLTYPEGS